MEEETEPIMEEETEPIMVGESFTVKCIVRPR